jgi:hypothetical protein
MHHGYWSIHQLCDSVDQTIKHGWQTRLANTVGPSKVKPSSLLVNPCDQIGLTNNTPKHTESTPTTNLEEGSGTPLSIELRRSSGKGA